MTCFDQATDDDFRHAYEILIMGFTWCLRDVLPDMKDGGWGRIVTLGSLCAKEPHRELPIVLHNLGRPAQLCLDAFHVVAWATTALDTLRRRMAAQLRRDGHRDAAQAIKHTRWALIKNPENLTAKQRLRLAELSRINHQLYRGYLIKEQVRAIFQARDNGGRGLLAELIGWCARCRIPASSSSAGPCAAISR